ncbi:MAG: YybH family protein [Nitrososphaera sp.]
MSEPIDTISSLIRAINSGDIETALSLYESEAILVFEPGKIVRGTAAIRSALEGFTSLKPTLKGELHQTLIVGDLALYCSKWALQGTSPDGTAVEMTGVSSDVLRRQSDGRWLVAIDNPWGTSIVN